MFHACPRWSALNCCALKEVKFPFYPCSRITYQYFLLLGDKHTTLFGRAPVNLSIIRGGFFYHKRGLAIGNEFLEAIPLRDSITA